MERDRLWWQALMFDGLAEQAFRSSHIALILSMKSPVWPVRFTARYR
jgi:hypothetical protein